MWLIDRYYQFVWSRYTKFSCFTSQPHNNTASVRQLPGTLRWFVKIIRMQVEWKTCAGSCSDTVMIDVPGLRRYSVYYFNSVYSVKVNIQEDTQHTFVVCLQPYFKSFYLFKSSFSDNLCFLPVQKFHYFYSSRLRSSSATCHFT